MAETLLGGLLAAGVVLLVVVYIVWRVSTAGRIVRSPLIQAKVDIVSLADAVNQYVLDHGGLYPMTLLDMVRPDATGHTYLKIVPLDPWGVLYRYEPPSPANPRPRVFTLGSDGKPGGAGEAADVDDSLIRDGKI